MSQRVIVLGADGFIGSHLLAALAASDWATPISAGRRSRAPGGANGPTRIQLDATDEAALHSALAGVDGVVNCIGGSAATIVRGAQALFNAAARQTVPPRIVHLSTIAVYGSVTGWVDEAAPLAGTVPYAQAKIAAEELCRGYSAAIVLRPGIVYGPGGPQWTGRIARWLQARRIGDLGAAGDGYCNLLYIGDLVSAAMQALRQQDFTVNVFNLAVPEPPTWNEYFVRFARALGAIPVTRIGRRRLSIETKILAPPLKFAEILCKKAGLRGLRLPEAIPPSFLRLCRQEIRMRVARAEESLHLRWTPIDDGLQQAASWAKQR
jgi:nucleoside-diphosphate-sugar epimerase